MDTIHVDGRSSSASCYQSTEEEDQVQTIRKGPWTEEEDFRLVHSINNHGEGRWDHLARSAGLKRTGKSCRFRWLNYLRPGIRRGNFTPQEQLLILELHFRWGNRWSKIAQFLRGRTDNEVKNYWRTMVQKQAKLLKCDPNSKQFQDTMRHVWMPRLVEQMGPHTSSSSSSSSFSGCKLYSLDEPTDNVTNIIMNTKLRGSITTADDPVNVMSLPAVISSTSTCEKEGGILQDHTPTNCNDINDCFQVEDFLDNIWNDIDEFVDVFLHEPPI